jgi:hypothetical protein
MFSFYHKYSMRHPYRGRVLETGHCISRGNRIVALANTPLAHKLERKDSSH